MFPARDRAVRAFSEVCDQSRGSVSAEKERTMRQVFKKLPVYTGDVSGVCSALFELGGMVVMHDPSGCNSTYNTHDEIRWYDHDSLIFISGLNEMEAVMGSDEALIRDITESARIYSPRFIAIANSPVPYITGMDFDGISRLIEQETGIPTFYITTNGMHDYVRGAGLAFLHLAERFAEGLPHNKKEKAWSGRGDQRPLRCNILGMTPLDFANPDSLKSLRAKIENAGMEIVSCWAMEDSLDNVRNSASADVNLVAASCGLPAARYMYKEFGIPFAAGIPAAGIEELYFEAVRSAAEKRENLFPFRDRSVLRAAAAGEKECSAVIEPEYSDQPVCLIGEPVIMTSLAASAEVRTGVKTCVFGATEGAEIFLGPEDAALAGEEELEKALLSFSQMSHAAHPVTDKPADIQTSDGVRVVSDPYYRDVFPPGYKLIPLPHLAFSGRILLNDIPDILQFKI